MVDQARLIKSGFKVTGQVPDQVSLRWWFYELPAELKNTSDFQDPDIFESMLALIDSLFERHDAYNFDGEAGQLYQRIFFRLSPFHVLLYSRMAWNV